jgi:signal transduction histidine kinase
VDGAKRMQALINDLLELSRVGRRGGEMVVLDADDLPEVRVEPSLGVALFQNLIANAIKFRRPDTAPTVRITVQRDGDVLRRAGEYADVVRRIDEFYLTIVRLSDAIDAS